jgi:hypothetical protein
MSSEGGWIVETLALTCLGVALGNSIERITMPKRGVNWAFLKINTN